MPKTNHDGSLNMKAIIAPQGNTDGETDGLNTDSNMFSPVGIRILLSQSSLRTCNRDKINIENAVLQTGKDDWDVYVVPAL